MKHHKTILACLVIIVPVFSFAYTYMNPSADEVMEEFHAGERGEIWIDVPLRRYADLVKTRVFRDIADKNMQYRLYAIGFLGECHIRESIPALCAILNDQTEEDVFRASALEALFLLDPGQTMDFAEQYAGRDDQLGYLAGFVRKGKLPWTDIAEVYHGNDDEEGDYCRRQ